ncbi:hypothetical protein HK102_003747 [Quaeritorhiza haematococci]|nr:hypothetical protein HK102_003747 [Quaeritorhiza haematococci]
MNLMIQNLLLAALVLRLGFLLYGEWQDRSLSSVKYTDIDYVVFTDAARFVAEGGSPYARATYRYTPLLAFLMLPNVTSWGFPQFGKMVFVACDLVAGILIYRILLMQFRRGRAEEVREAATEGKVKEGSNTSALQQQQRSACIYTAVWLLNPFVTTISTRGSCEAVLAAMVLSSLYCILSGRLWIGSALFGLAVHFKIYPIVYALPILMFLDERYKTRTRRSTNPGNETRKEGKQKAQDSPNVKTSLLVSLIRFCNRQRIEFGLISGGVFLALSALMYILYGHDFLQETYLYHVTRKDHRHNFSIYFYHIYLTYLRPTSTLAGLLAFIPQLGTVAIIGFPLAKVDLVFACFAQTYAFVMLNKVCTAQYFMWYLCFLPIILPSSKLTSTHRKTGVLLLIAWVLGQALWLYYAFRLEHLGHNTYRQLWYSSVAFLLVNVVVLISFIRYHELERYEKVEEVSNVDINDTKTLKEGGKGKIQFVAETTATTLRQRSKVTNTEGALQ